MVKGDSKITEFRGVYEAYYPRVYAFVLKRVGDAHIAQDLAQDVMVACYMAYDRYDSGKASLSTWIYTIAKNKLKNYYRDRKPTEDIDEYADSNLMISGESIEEALLLDEAFGIVQNLLSELNERERAVVTLKYRDNLTSQAIADTLGLTATNVRVILKRTLDKLQKMLLDQGYER